MDPCYTPIGSSTIAFSIDALNLGSIIIIL